jgi:hypothetical protein
MSAATKKTTVAARRGSTDGKKEDAKAAFGAAAAKKADHKPASSSASTPTGASAAAAKAKAGDGKSAAAGTSSLKDKRPKGLPVLKVNVPAAAEVRQARRRLSLATGNPADKDKNVTSLDGAAPPGLFAFVWGCLSASSSLIDGCGRG